jgi:hypothetical protein
MPVARKRHQATTPPKSQSSAGKFNGNGQSHPRADDVHALMLDDQAKSPLTDKGMFLQTSLHGLRG